jgi:hypothetical protein
MESLSSVVQNVDIVTARASVEQKTASSSPASDTLPEPGLRSAPADLVPPVGTSNAPAGLPGLPAAAAREQKRPRPAWRWAAAPILAAAAYVCWVLARQVLWGMQESEPWTLLSISSLVYLVAVAWTMVLVAVTVWNTHRAGRFLWPWALFVCGPGLAYLYHFAAINKDWGGGVGAEFYEMIALVAALGLLALAALVGLSARLAPPARRLLRRRRREPSSGPSG